MKEQLDKNTKEHIKKNWRIILVMTAFIISLVVVAAVSYLVTSHFYNQRIAEGERHIQEHEQNLQKCEQVKGWFQGYLSDCEERAGEYYKVLEEHNLSIPD